MSCTLVVSGYKEKKTVRTKYYVEKIHSCTLQEVCASLSHTYPLLYVFNLRYLHSSKNIDINIECTFYPTKVDPCAARLQSAGGRPSRHLSRRRPRLQTWPRPAARGSRPARRRSESTFVSSFIFPNSTFHLQVRLLQTQLEILTRRLGVTSRGRAGGDATLDAGLLLWSLWPLPCTLLLSLSISFIGHNNKISDNRVVIQFVI